MSLAVKSGKKVPMATGEGRNLPRAVRFLDHLGIWQMLAQGRYGILGLLLLFILGLHPEILLGSGSLFYRDFGLFGAPVAAFHRQAFWEGQVPLWNALNNCGLPFAAQWNTLVFYPFSLLYLLLPFPWSLNLFSVVHLVLGGVSMYLLAQDWLSGRHLAAASVAAFAFAWNGLTLHSLMWPNNIAAYGWLPLVVLHLKHGCLKGGQALFAGALIAGVQMLTGAPEIIMFTWMLGIGYLLMKCGGAAGIPAVMRLMAMAALVFGLTAIQLLPFAGFLDASHRDQHLAAGDAWAMPGWGIANFFVPLFRCTPSLLGVFSQNEQQWTSSYYMGSGVMVLALLALWKARSWRVCLLGCCLLAGLWFAMGREGGLYSVIMRVFPFTGFARYPIKLVVVCAVIFALLAAEGLAWALEKPDKSRGRAVLYSGLSCLGVIGLVLLVALLLPFPGDDWTATWRSGIRSAMWVSIFTGLVLVIPEAKSWFLRIGGIALLLVTMGLDIATHAPRQNPVVSLDALCPAEGQGGTEPVTFKPRAMLSGSFKAFIGHAATSDAYETLTGYRRALFGNANLYNFHPKADGFFSLYLNEESALRNGLEATPHFETLPILDFMGVEKVPHPSVLFEWVNRTNLLPLVTGGQSPVFVDSEQSLRRVMSKSFEPSREVILPRLAEREAETNYDPHPVFSEFRTRKAGLDFTAKAANPAWVVVAQNFHEPWKLSIDGQQAKLWQANHAFQAFKIPAGEHRIQMRYVDAKFLWGTALSLSCLGLCITGACLPRRLGGDQSFAEQVAEPRQIKEEQL